MKSRTFSNKNLTLNYTMLRGSLATPIEMCKQGLSGILQKPYFQFVQRPLYRTCVTAYTGKLPTSSTSTFQNLIKKHHLKKAFLGENLRTHFLENFDLAESTLFIGVPIEENHYKYYTSAFSHFFPYRNSKKCTKSSGITLIFPYLSIPPFYSL